MSEKPQEWSAEEIEVIKEHIITALETVIDPELGVDIVNLGLIYGVDFQPTGETVIKMTLTTMGCPIVDLLTEQIHEALNEVPEIKTVEVKLVWYPAWTTDKMSRYARIALGIR
ncbi:metal-sulfur cluster assembly factor [Melissococcus plutonius]|uniref:Probably aromatic ring hydroxylating enzyme, PaaD-like protein involved in Fe-S cluster assembly n=2 Tax=Melissococcus plutonius TaxID=33970 RepID=F3YAM4_MELPT|nr:metal-sulfur cluster assembly factor [Melissococcus plutonius]BAL62089.1 putative aromatic ring hydroxylating protein [Melissococcus plutonius DAT561]AIM25010.1 putative aromatic ring hydroxylating protein [Melissococcus plutonius S1]KMT25177.1 putative aromatic ring hydroxylating protein [Melissococcus plutonius]KMT26083.1 putative aromatic ring hydroxylating protein [Melissococcus plutonius]KMT26813.1 putative aromatic ring hydroxylating protein [Melissococcus plutonius]